MEPTDPHGDVLTRIAVLEANLVSEKVRLSDAFSSRDKALEVALTSMNAHLQVMNEFRGTIQDQASRFITRGEHDIMTSQITQMQINAKSTASEYVPRRDLDQMTARLETMEKSQSNLQGRYAMVAIFFAAAVSIGTVIVEWSRNDVGGSHGTLEAKIEQLSHSIEVGDAALNQRLQIIEQQHTK